MTLLHLDGVGRTYREEPPIVALTDVSLAVHRGEFVAIEGPSGSGKSSLLNVIALLDRPSIGSYRIDASDTGSLTERDRATVRSRTFGFIFQSFHLIAQRSALENVELGLLYHGIGRQERRARALQALRSVGMAHRADQAAGKLSGGEAQRVAIARAIVGNAEVIVADEPTGNLDTVTSQGIVEQLESLHESGTTVVLVTHDPEVAAVASRRIRVRDGRIVGDDAGAAAQPQDAPQRPATAAPTSGPRPDELAREALRAIQGRPGRSATLVAAVAVAVALVVATTGLAQTASSQVSDRFDARRNREVTVTAPDVAARATADAVRSSLPHDAEARVRALAGVTDAGVMGTYDQRSVRTLATVPAQVLPLIGVTPGLMQTVGARIGWAPGHRHRLGARELLLGAGPARQLELSALTTDPVVLVDGVPFGVVGVIRSVRRAPEILAGIVASQNDASTFDQPASLQMLIGTAAGAAPQVARQAPIALDPAAPDRFEVRAPVDPSSLRDAIQSDLASTLLALTLVATLASMIGVANAMMVSVIERIGELGLRRALGARPVHILAQTSIEALLLGLAGGVAGFFAGSAGVLAVTVVNHWQPVLDLRLVPVALAGGALVGVLGGLAAAIRASRIQPVAALRQ